MEQLCFFHGTDARIIEMTRDERLEYLDGCNLVIDALYPLFKPLLGWEKVVGVINGEKVYYYEHPLKLRYEKLLKEKGGAGMYLNLFEKLTMIDFCSSSVTPAKLISLSMYVFEYFPSGRVNMPLSSIASTEKIS